MRPGLRNAVGYISHNVDKYLNSGVLILDFLVDFASGGIFKKPAIPR
jgi:hypothetical protein